MDNKNDGEEFKEMVVQVVFDGFDDVNRLEELYNLVLLIVNIGNFVFLEFLSVEVFDVLCFVIMLIFVCQFFKICF